MGKRRLLTDLKVDEVSGVDEPANDEARVLLMKAADAIPEIASIRKALSDAHGEDAAEAFNDILAEAADPIAGLVAKAAEDADLLSGLSRAAHALGESVDSIYKGADTDDARADLLVETGEQFAAAVADMADEAGVQKAADMPPVKAKAKAKGGDSFKPCADCPDHAACKAAGACAAAGAAAPVRKAADAAAELASAIAEHAEAVQKAAATFNELNANREEREKLNRMAWALQDSITSIMSDPEVKPKDKPAMIRKSVGEFDAAVAAMMGNQTISKRAATGGSKESTMKDRDPSGDARDEITKALRDQLAELMSREAKREAIAKAKGMLPAGGPVDALGALLASASAEQVPHIEAVVKGLAAQVDASRLFGAYGATVGGDLDAVAESPVVKAARAHAEAVQKRRLGRAA